ncbi:TIGR02680 family protein [Streptomyces sp. 3MP-14]|uniref:TIGR02680 family protein n=1 Tax=Streptomyces mimosae TaxID=2586635 RepID=A0A5N6AJY4_9ACTN|nr:MULTISPECIES: TIGR02680 family protein [Streptomyces]KAB8167888.1 TIGR02680 family protein [Streptomyces mimosae]KAB8177464.1 TIGR02680 family protein [Streptomyces sp. 3MP-14]
MSVTELPLPRRQGATGPQLAPAGPGGADVGRWRPHRAGILNVWRYYDEVFTFHRGRLLLRGQNGSGKSKALELLLPFLFDASLRPHRLSTFGGSERTMHWNLMGEGATGKTRVGYVWIEFGRVDEDGAERWFGCGARLQASTHTSGVHVDYFTTEARIGWPGGVFLVNETGQPLTRAALAAALGDRGEMHPSAAEHRTAVRRTLFAGMGEQRYESLLSALLQLRQPKLSERLDPSLLSTLLSRALPPLGEGEIAELAEGFERLDRQREYLTRLDDEVKAAGSVASRQRDYARRVLRAGAAALISATTDMDNLTRVARLSAEHLERAEAERTSTVVRRRELAERAHTLEETIEGLRESEAYQRGAELDRLRGRVEDATAAARARRARARAAGSRAQDGRLSAERAALQARSLDAHARQAADEARATARAAGLESVHHEVRTLLAGPGALAGGRGEETPPPTGTEAGGSGVPGEQRAGRARQLARGAAEARRHQITQVGEVLDGHETAVRDREAAEEALEVSRTRLTEAMGRRDEAVGARDEALASQAERLLTWAASCAELRFADPDQLADLADAEPEVLALTEAVARPLEREIATAEATVEAERRARADELGRAEEEMLRLRREKDLPPTPPLTRTTDRTTVPGAPLWRLVAFRDDVPAAARAGVEAALEASGLLDAWVSPDEGIALPGHDTRVDAALAVPAPGPSLSQVLRPEEDAPVPAEIVARLLAGIAYGPPATGDHPVAVSADGSWRLALATGTWAKPEPAHIGALARQRARQRRIDELAGRVDEMRSALAALDDQSRALAARRARLDADRAARPDHRETQARADELARAEERVAARDDAVRDAATRLGRAEDEVEAALRALTHRAVEHGLPTDRGRLRQLSGAIDRFRDATDAWVDAHLAARAAADTARQLAGHAERARGEAEEQERDADEAESTATGLGARLAAVAATVGEDYRQVVARVGEARDELRRCREEAAAAEGLLLRLQHRIGELTATSRGDTERRESAVATRDEAARRFRHLCATGLAEDAGFAERPGAEGGARATLEAARALAARWSDLPHAPRHLGDAATRLSEAVHEARQRLGARADLELEPDEDIQLLTASLDGVRVGATGLLGALTQERDRGRDDITAAERGLFDQILTGDIRRHLAARIRRAHELVDRMNGHLERVRTASQVAVRLVWDVRPDLPDGTRAARELLLKDPSRATAADREALHDFFRARIEEAKAADTATSWEEQLGEVLDYTAWHRFTVRLDRANGAGWQPLTKKLHGALSGGEKAIALHLPLFAAVAAHYEAVPLAPRPILLDEVFVGVDTVNRGQIFALLTALDLDLVLTSDHEWGTYRELPGIAVHQLLTGAGDDAVTSARFVWSGSDWEEG